MREPMRVLICGDRNWTDDDMVLEELLRETKEARTVDVDVVVIHGCARGADTAGGLAAMSLGFEVQRFPAQWDRYGKRAGILRNQQMLDEGKPDLVLAFHDDLANSKGTGHMVRIARAAGVPVRVVTHGTA